MKNKALHGGCSCTEHEHDGCSCTEHEHDGCSCTEHEHDGCSCGCGDCGHDHEKVAGNLEKGLWLASFILFVITVFVPMPDLLRALLFAAVVLLAGYDLLFGGLKEIVGLRLRENSLLLIAVAASFALGEFAEACMVTILFKLGEFIEAYAISRSKKDVEALAKIRPDAALVKNADGELISVAAETVEIGDVVFLRAGDRVALDCEVISGSSTLDCSALTGESLPQTAEKGEILLSGSVNISGVLECKVIRSFKNSAASQIIDMVYSSSAKKGKAENFISRFAKYYTPTVVILAVILAALPPLIGLGESKDYIMRALIFLVASCPCALVISIPLSFFSTIGVLSKNGVLVKGSMYIEALAKAKAVCFDKTGTITSGRLSVDEAVASDGGDRTALLGALWGLEEFSTHPIAQSVTAYAAESGAEKQIFDNAAELAGFGVTAEKDGAQYLCGSAKLLQKYNIDVSSLPAANIYLVKNGRPLGFVRMKEEIQNDSLSIVEQLKTIGVKRAVMLTGDNKASAKKVAARCGFEEYYAELLPGDKVTQINKIKQDGTTLFVGDGINDAPVIVEADVGLSMGFGSEIANASADAVLSSNRLSSLPKAIALSQRGMRVVYFNIAFALIVKLTVLILGAAGFGTMWEAVFADIGVTIIAVINAARVLRFKA